MGVIDKVLSLFSRRGMAIARYRTGMQLAKNGKFEAAIADYTLAIDSRNVPPDVLAMALFNRSLAYSSIDRDSLAAADLSSLFDIPGLPENIRLQAHHRRERLKKRDPHRIAAVGEES